MDIYTCISSGQVSPNETVSIMQFDWFTKNSGSFTNSQRSKILNWSFSATSANIGQDHLELSLCVYGYLGTNSTELIVNPLDIHSPPYANGIYSHPSQSDSPPAFGVIEQHEVLPSQYVYIEYPNTEEPRMNLYGLGFRLNNKDINLISNYNLVVTFSS
jgi:hypothetical protein